MQRQFIFSFTFIIGFLVAAEVLFADNKTILRSYPIPGHGVLELPVPTSWSDEIEKSTAGVPPTITFRPKAGEPFEVLVSVMWSPTREAGYNDTATIRRHVERSGLALLPTAVESTLTLEEIRGRAVIGYYYAFTDKAPKSGEYKYLTQGEVGIGDLLLSFTILTPMKDARTVHNALTMLVQAEQRYPRQENKSKKTTLSARQMDEFIEFAIHGDTAGIESVLSSGVDVDVRDAKGNTVLMEAAVVGQADTVKYLLGKGADVNATNHRGETALINAARMGHASSVQVLLAHHATVNVHDKDGWTALMYAARNDRAQAVEALIANGADVQEKGYAGITPLMAASASADVKVVRTLLAKGADISARDRSGWTPLIFAAANGRAGTIEILLRNGADIEAKDAIDSQTALMQAVIKNRPTAMQALLTHGANVNAKDQSGKTALMFASEDGRTDFTSVLLDAGADVDAKDTEGQTALDIATAKNHHTIIQLLTKAKKVR